MFVNTQIPGESAKMFRNKIPFGQIVPLFSSNVQNLTVFVFSIIFMIRIRFFGLRESFQQGFRAAQYHSGQESLMTGLSRETGASGNLMRCFHVTMFFRFADPASVGKSLLDGNKDLNELMRQEHQGRSLNNCIDELQQQAYAQRLELGDGHDGFFESRQQQARLQEESSMKEQVLRKTQIRFFHEMEKKRAQELRVEEFLYKN